MEPCGAKRKLTALRAVVLAQLGNHTFSLCPTRNAQVGPLGIECINDLACDFQGVRAAPAATSRAATAAATCTAVLTSCPFRP